MVIILLRVFKTLAIFVFILLNLTSFAHGQGTLDEPELESDTLVWPRSHNEARRIWLTRTRQFVALKSSAVERYLDLLGNEFLITNEKNIQARKRRPLRFHFFIADTLNPSLWSYGSGYFVLHGGLLNGVLNHQQFTFLIALEMAHQILGHEPSDDGRIVGAWSADGFATLVVNDPVLKRSFSYSRIQETQALELVAPLFNSWGWNYAQIAKQMVPAINELTKFPGASSVGLAHRHLALALKLPEPAAHTSVGKAPEFLSAASFQQIQNELLRSAQQRYAWFLGLASYLPPQFDVVARPSSFLDLDLRAFRALKESYSKRGIKSPASLERWIENRIHLNHRDWSSVEDYEADEVQEPILFQKLHALQIQGNFESCLKDSEHQWIHREYERELIRAQCVVLMGHLSEGLEHIKNFVVANPLDIRGGFWHVLVLARLHDPKLFEVQREYQQKWGDRPWTRAAQIIALARNGRWNQIQELDADTFSVFEKAYGDEERGALLFAKAWAEYQKHQRPTASAISLLKQAQRLWPLTLQNNALYPQERR